MSFRRKRRSGEKPMVKVNRSKMKDAMELYADEMLDEAEKRDYDIDEYLVKKFPPDIESKDQRDALTYALEECYDVELTGSRSSKLDQFDLDEPKTDHVPTQLLNMHFTKTFCDTVVNQRASVAGLTSGRPWTEETIAPVQNPVDYAPSLNWRELASNVERIRGDSYRLPRTNNLAAEREWEIIPETGGEPAAMVLAQASDLAEFDTYRKKLTTTYDFMRNNQNRVALIANAILELAGGLSNAFKKRFVKAIYDAVPSGNVTTLSGSDLLGHNHAAGTITVAEWDQVQLDFGGYFQPNRIICNPKGYRAIRAMAAQSGQNFVLRREVRRQDPDLIPEFSSMNTGGQSIRYGWVDDVTEIVDNELLVWDVMSTLRVLYQVGAEQDEIERLPGPQIMNRLFGLKVAQIILRKEKNLRKVGY